jgi:hypothetical protein
MTPSDPHTGSPPAAHIRGQSFLAPATNRAETQRAQRLLFGLFSTTANHRMKQFSGAHGFARQSFWCVPICLFGAMPINDQKIS